MWDQTTVDFLLFDHGIPEGLILFNWKFADCRNRQFGGGGLL